MIYWPLKYRAGLYNVYNKMIRDVYYACPLAPENIVKVFGNVLCTNWSLNPVHLKDHRKMCYMPPPKGAICITVYNCMKISNFQLKESFCFFIDVYASIHALGLHGKGMFLKGVWQTDEGLGSDKPCTQIYHTADFLSIKDTADILSVT